jgi:hypothetical protein
MIGSTARRGNLVTRPATPGCARVADVIVWVNGAFGSDKTTLVDLQPVAGLATAVPAEVSD